MSRAAFESHWLATRGAKRARRELIRHLAQPQCYIEDSANRHWVTWQAASRVQADEIERMRDALETIALAGMSGSGQESDEGMRDWHARRAWEFIGIAARAITAPKGDV